MTEIYNHVTAPVVTLSEFSLWKTDNSYNIGEIVEWKNNNYKCLQPHVSHSGNSNNKSSWSPGTLYNIDDFVTYNNTTYKCVQSHMSHTGWNPESTLNILWSK